MYISFMNSIKALLLALCITTAGILQAAVTDRFTLVIDAGHGGHDSGAKGSFSYEKNINLSVALAFGKYVERNCPDVRVVYTRKKDVFVPLYERAEIANRNKANLFVSVHTNALPKGRIARGFETYTLGDGRSHGTKTNLDVAKRENSVIFMEKDYKQHYVGYDPNSAESNIMFEFVQDHNMQQSVEFAKLLQRNVCSMAGRINKGVHQDNFAVLRLTSMPACLIELGFITTPDEEKALNDANMVDRIGRGIYNAFIEYKSKQAGGITIPYKPLPEADNEVETKNETKNKPEAKNDAKPETKNDAKPGAKNNTKPEAKTNVQSEQSLMALEEDIITFDEKAGKATNNKPVAKPTQEVKQTAAKPTSVAKPIQETKLAQETKPVQETKSAQETKPASMAQNVEQSAPVFKIQIMTSSRKLKANDAAFKGLKGVDFYSEGNSYKYTYGASANYNEIYRLRKEIVEQFPSCFIIALKDGQRMDVNEAIKLFKRNRNK